jgi:hypothetical protein
VLHLRLIILSVGGDVPVDSEILLVTDFMNLKIKPPQCFRCAHKGRVCVCVFIGVSAHTCMSICVCTLFLIFFTSILSEPPHCFSFAVTSFSVVC